MSQTNGKQELQSDESSAQSATLSSFYTDADVSILPTLSGGATGLTLNNDLLAAFECPVCLEYMVPPYLQCNSGHLVCSNCRPKVNVCPTCRGPGPNIRNLALEKIAESMSFPCRYTSSGCSVHMMANKKIDHEETCEYRPYSCPCPGAACKWQGALTSVLTHLQRQHKSITTLQGEDIVFLATDINLPGAVDWVMMQHCYDRYFMLVLEKQDKCSSAGSKQVFYAVVQLIGAKKDTDDFTYRLELTSGRRRLSFESLPRSIHESVGDSISSGDCLFFDMKLATLFSENGSLGINVTISQKESPVSGTG